MPVYIIEHLEPELGEWCLIEYEHISTIVGKENLWFTNVKKEDIKKLEPLGKVFEQSVSKIALDLSKTCVLDMETNQELTPNEAKTFNYFVFGGILGDYPPRKRTKEELTPLLKGAQVRHLGKEQFATDNAISLVKEIVQGKKLEEIEFIQGITIPINDILETSLPFRYLSINGKPLISPKLVEHIKKVDSEED